MGEILAFSPSSLLLSPHFQLHFSRQGLVPFTRIHVSPMCTLSTSLTSVPIISSEQKKRSWATLASVVSDSIAPTTFTVDSGGGGIDILPDSGGSNDNFGGISGNDGSGGGGGGDGSDESKDQSGDGEKKKGMSMSQKLTLGYAALVGIGGLMGYLKGGSQKSLIAGGVSASLLFMVYSILPSNPVLASSIGLGLSASLLVVMGSRFKKSGKVFPAGVVSCVSFIMTGGYLHGILRSLH